jgi:hypothetical protein
VIVHFLQCGSDVIAERGRHIRSGSDDPAEPGHRGDCQQHVGDLVLARTRRHRPSDGPLQAYSRRRSGDTCPYPEQHRGLWIQGRRRSQVKPKPGFTFPAWYCSTGPRG